MTAGRGGAADPAAVVATYGGRADAADGQGDGDGAGGGDRKCAGCAAM